MKTIENFMENYSAYIALKEFESFVEDNKKMNSTDQIKLIHEKLISKVGAEKADLLALFSEHIKTNFKEYKRNSLHQINQLLLNSYKKNIVFCFGRMNPPTKAHGLLIEKVIEEAKLHNAEPRVYLSQTQDSDKNPLSVSEKQKIINSVYKGLDVRVDAKNAFDVMVKLTEEKNVGHVILLTGSDQVTGYKNIQKYIDKGEYKVDSFEVKSIGERNENLESFEGISASKVRKMIKEQRSNDSIKSILLEGISDKYISKIITTIYNG